MAYIGNNNTNLYKGIARQQASGDGSTTVFALNQSVSTESDVEVFVENVRQEPSSAYTISGGTSLTFTSAPPVGTNNIYFLFQGAQGLTSVPTDGSVGASQHKSFNKPYLNKQEMTANVTIDASDNAFVVGPVSYSGTLTIEDGATLVVI